MSDLLTILGVLAGVVGAIGVAMLFPPVAALVLTLANSRFGQAVIAIGAAVLAVLAIRSKARREGADEARQEIAGENAKAVQRRKEVRGDVETRSDEQLRDKLREYRRRD